MVLRDEGPPEEKLLAVAVHGNVTTEQLLAAGVTKSAIAYRTRQKRLFRVHRGVYALGRPPSRPLERAAAAVLACGADAALSHSSALTLWGLAKRWGEPFHVAVPTRHKRSGIVVHEITNLTRTDIRSHSGIRVTSPARALLDSAPALTTKRLRRAMADARRAGLIHPAALIDLLERNPSHLGGAPLRATMSDHAPTRSEFEDAFLVFCERHNLPRPRVNVTIAGYEADAYFPDAGLIVQLDGWDYHQDREVFEGDRLRDGDALIAGVPTFRVSWEQLSVRPAELAARLHAALRTWREQAART